jgi:hypothetical protein
MKVVAWVLGARRVASAHVRLGFDLSVAANPTNPWEGDSVTFTATSSVALPNGVDGWFWQDATTPPGGTQVCVHNQLTCRIPIFASGTMRVAATVPGVSTEQATVQVVARPPEAQIACSPGGLVRGGQVACTAQLNPGRPFWIRSVQAVTAIGAFFLPVPGSQFQAGAVYNFSGTAAISTTVNVGIEYVIGSQTKNLGGSASFSVTARNWPDIQRAPATTFTVDRAPGVLGSLLDPLPNGRAGASVFYPPNHAGVPVEVISSGPNLGFVFATERPSLQQPPIYLNPDLYSGPWFSDQNGGTHPDGSARCTNGAGGTTNHVAILRQEALRHEGLNGAQPSHHSVEAQAIADYGLTNGYEGLVTRPAGTPQQAESAFRVDLNAVWAGFATFDAQRQQNFDAAEVSAIWVTPYGGCTFDQNPNDP